MLDLSIKEQKEILAGWNAVIYDKNYHELYYKYFSNKADAYRWARNEVREGRGDNYCVLEG